MDCYNIPGRVYNQPDSPGTYFACLQTIFRFTLLVCSLKPITFKKLEKTFSRLDELQNLITSEMEKYKLAIATDKPFEEVKQIYLRIKELKQQSLELLEEANSKIEKSKK